MFDVGAIFRVVMYGTFSTLFEFSNVFQFELVTGTTPLSFEEVVADMDEVIEEIATLWAMNLWDGITIDQYSVATLDDNLVSGKVALTNLQVGDLAEEPLPSQTTLNMTFATGVSGRIMKKYVAGLTEPQTGVNQGNFESSTVATWLAVAGTLLFPIEATNASWLYVYNNTPGSAEGLIRPVSAAVSNIPKVQRRRRPS